MGSGHGKWQYVREDALLPIIDGFFEQHLFGEQRIARFLEQRATLAGELRSEGRQPHASGRTTATASTTRLHATNAGDNSSTATLMKK
jgi:hypothetical protein